MMRNGVGKRKKIIVALSGGVDSAVAAALLKKQGHEVAGVFLNLGNWGNRGLANAKKITAKLKIPLKVIDARKVFKKRVINYFLDAYKNGLTPNPCVVCNKEIKFDLLFRLMRKLKADYVATGHYARKVKSQMSNVKSKEVFIYKLLQAKDKTKDQSYFLYRLSQKDLSKIIFPLGDYKKLEVKNLAKRMGLPTAKEESQDICFVRDNGVNQFLRQCIKMKPGKIVDMDGNILGKHQGLPLYTIGQRKGIEIGGTGPYFVVGKDVQKNELIVTNDQRKLLAKKFWVSRVNWVRPYTKIFRQRRFGVGVKIRYRADKFSAIIRKSGNRYIISTKKKLRAVTTGQSAVFYRNKEVLGGGIIL